nr:MAG TPA: hypothetical protein [Caudoviricetes sp.]
MKLFLKFLKQKGTSSTENRRWSPPRDRCLCVGEIFLLKVDYQRTERRGRDGK